jgi:hypothetical protein
VVFQKPEAVFFLGVSFCIVVTNVFGECRFKSINCKNEENYKKIETKKIGKKKLVL